MSLPTETKSRKSVDRGAYVQNKDVVSVLPDGRKLTFGQIRDHILAANPALKGRAQKWILWFLADEYATRVMAKKS